jgi:hypothetical protein
VIGISSDAQSTRRRAERRFGMGSGRCGVLTPDEAQRLPGQIAFGGDRRELIAASQHEGLVESVPKANKRCIAGNSKRAATSDEVRDLRRDASAPMEIIADLSCRTARRINCAILSTCKKFRSHIAQPRHEARWNRPERALFLFCK